MTYRPIKTAAAQIHIHSIETLEINSGAHQTGIYEIAHHLPIHARWINRKSNITFVTFSAAVMKTATVVPIFSGAGTTSHLEANVLMLSDPSLILDANFNLAWYAGNHYQPTLQTDLSRIINAFRGNSRLILFGASGGGFAALEQALRIPGVDAIVANPQTNLTKYSYYPTYLKLGWDSRYIAPSIPPVQTEVVSGYTQPVASRVIYIQNSGDGAHVENHWTPFHENLHPQNRVHLMDDYLGDGHIAPDSDSFKKIFSTVCDNPDWNTLKATLAELTVTSRLTSQT